MIDRQIHHGSLNSEFARSANEAKSPKKRLPPVSIRFTEEQREQLKADAGGLPISTYLKELAFEGSPTSRKRARSIIQDYEMLAQLLSALGKSNIFANLDLLLQAAESGNLKLNPETLYEIEVACTAVLDMRDNLCYALGLRTGNNK